MLCIYKITLRLVNATIFKVEEQRLFSCLGCFSANYPGRKVHAHYFVLTCSLSDRTTFFYLSSLKAQVCEKCFRA